MTIERMDHVNVVVEDPAAAIAFFTALGMTLEHDYAAAFGQAEDRRRFAGAWLYSATAGHGPFRWPPVKRAG